jgi:hypothetical protein
MSVVAILSVVVAALLFPFATSAQTAVRHGNHHTHTENPDSIAASAVAASDTIQRASISELLKREEIGSAELDNAGELTAGEAYEVDSIQRSSRNASIMRKLSDIPEEEWVPRDVEFNPDPNRAVWLSALFPGLGQLYNRRYWKLPIIIGGYLGLGYATSWNNQMLKDYTRAYSDLLDNDPSSDSYMDFFSPNVKESDIDKTWLQNLLKSRKNYFRRNRDLCIISMVGVYLLAMVDAYVDASLSHFDISPRLSMDVVPAVMQDGRQPYPSVGLAWALNF